MNVYEAVDATSDEQYYTLGVWLDLATARAALDTVTPDDMPGDHDDYEDVCRVEIRERKLGWGGVGVRVRVWEWRREYDEAADEYRWVNAEHEPPRERKP
jgi:hypothetical protein